MSKRLSDEDREAWRWAMRDTQPLANCQLPAIPLANKPQPPTNSKPKPTLWDLHGLTLNEAYQLVKGESKPGETTPRYVQFITGRSGEMRRQLPLWLASNPHVRSVEPTGNGGSFRVWFKTAKKSRRP